MTCPYQITNPILKRQYDPYYSLSAEDQTRFLQSLKRHGWDHTLAERSTVMTLLRAHCAAVRTGKGMIIAGGLGAGKTTFMLAYRYFWRHGMLIFDLHEDEDVERLATVLDPHRPLNPRDYNIYIDDVGVEREQNDYGIRSELVDRLIGFLAADVARKGRLFITTNKNMDTFLDRYGGRDVSRLGALCVPAIYKGIDRRPFEKTGQVPLEVKRPEGPVIEDLFNSPEFVRTAGRVAAGMRVSGDVD